MQKSPLYYHSYTLPERVKSLGLQTPISFELKLLEAAVKGRKIFESTWNEKATIYEQVMFLEILQEINVWEKDGCCKLLQDRARNLVVRLKAHKNLHQKALVVYRDFLNPKGSPTSTEYSISQHREVKKMVSSAVPYQNELIGSSQLLTLDEKFDVVMGVEFPDTDEDGSSISKGPCSRRTPGETSPSCELISSDGERFAESLSVFRKPPMIDEAVVTPWNFTLKELSGTDSKTRKSEGEVKSLSVANQDIRFSKVCLDDKPLPQSVLNKCFEQKESNEFSCGNDEDENMDFEREQHYQVLGNFPQKDFKFLLCWVVDTVTYRAKNPADLRNKHNVLVEGEFKKRCRSRRWRKYYGFILDTGVMIYFRKGVFKKVADFRNSTRILQKVKQCNLDIRDVYLASKPTSWSLQFDSAKICKVWHKIILKISQNNINKIDELQRSFVSLSECI